MISACSSPRSPFKRFFLSLQQFALQEASFFLVKLLQQFTNFTLAPDAQPEDSKPPAGWAEGGGRRATEKIRPAMHLTLFVKVSMEKLSLTEQVDANVR